MARFAAGPSSRPWSRTPHGRRRVVAASDAALQATLASLAERERALADAAAAAEQVADAERQAVAAREDAVRLASNLTRESADSESQLARLTERLDRSEQRMTEIDAALVDGELARSRLDEELGTARALQSDLEAEQETRPGAAGPLAGAGSARRRRPSLGRRAARAGARDAGRGRGGGTDARR